MEKEGRNINDKEGSVILIEKEGSNINGKREKSDEKGKNYNKESEEIMAIK